MGKRADVGRSWRTYAKHDLMWSFLGEEVGAVDNMRKLSRRVWLDLTAGDAAQVDGVEWARACSPGVLASRAKTGNKPTSIVLHEIQPATYARLVTNLEAQLPALGYEQTGEASWRHGGRVSLTAVNASGAQADVGFLRRSDAVFVLNDPNAMTEWAMRDGFAREIARKGVWALRSFSTLGCNPAGLKRLDLEERQLWFHNVNEQQSSTPRYRDMLLAAIERDEAQWAYLISTATRWRDKTENVVTTAFRKVGRTAAMSWARQDAAEFEELKRLLFLTRQERSGDAA